MTRFVVANWKWRLVGPHADILFFAAADAPPKKVEPLTAWLAVAELKRFVANADPMVANAGHMAIGDGHYFENGPGHNVAGARAPESLYDALIGGLIRAYRRSRVELSRPLLDAEELTPQPLSGDADDTGWVEIELVDMEDQPVGGERYKLTLPDGTVVEGSTSATGAVRIPSSASGKCAFTFPDLDQQAWEPA